MTPLLKDPESRDAKAPWKDPAHPPLPLLGDFRDTLGEFWGLTVSPVACMLSQTLGILWKQAFIPSFQNWLISSKERFQSLMTGKPYTAKKTQSPAAVPVFRVHGALGERWTQEGGNKRPIRLHTGKQNPWIAAERNVSVLKPSRNLSAAQEREVIRMASALAVAAEDEIRGLDDIFTGPVQGSFLDVLNASDRSSKSNTIVAVDKTAGRQPERALDAAGPQQAPKVAVADRMATLARNQEALREEARKLGSRVKNIADSTRDWFNKSEPVKVEPNQPDQGSVPSIAPAFYASFVDEAVAAFAPAPQQQVDKIAEEPVDLAPPVLEPPALLPDVPQALPRQVATESVPAPAQMFKQKPLVVPGANPNPVSQPLPKPPKLSYELADDDLSGFEYMIQNNRILSNSITNLVDRYFHQAALEDEPNYY